MITMKITITAMKKSKKIMMSHLLTCNYLLKMAYVLNSLIKVQKLIL